MANVLSDGQATQVHQIAQTTILAMFFRGFANEACTGNDQIRRVVMAFEADGSVQRDDVLLTLVGPGDEVLASFSI